VNLIRSESVRHGTLDVPLLVKGGYCWGPGDVALTPKADVAQQIGFVLYVRGGRLLLAAAALPFLIWRTKHLYTKALSPVIALPTIKVFISRVPS
jgi:hypothetical protein